MPAVTPGASLPRRHRPLWPVQALLVAALLQLWAPMLAGRAALAAWSDPLASMPVCSEAGSVEHHPGPQHRHSAVCTVCLACCAQQQFIEPATSMAVTYQRLSVIRRTRRVLANAPRGPPRGRPRSRSPPTLT